MSVAANIDMNADELILVKWGLIYKCVCAPKSWDAEKVSAQASLIDPPGTSANRWECTDTSSFADGHPFKNNNPQPCNDDPNRRHWVLNC
jgi:hypothetical protein